MVCFQVFLLLAGVEAVVRNEVEAWEFVDLDTSKDGGASNLHRWGWVETMPTGDFCISQWLTVDPASTSQAVNVWFNSDGSEQIAFKVVANVFTITTDYNDFDTQALADSTKWFHVAMGINAGLAYYVITLKDGAQLQNTQQYLHVASLDTWITAPEIKDNRFIVSST